MSRTPVSALRRLANLYGVQTAYYDVSGRRQQAQPESLLTMLRLLGASVQTLNDVPTALRERQQAWWQRGVEPVVVVWDGAPASCTLRLPAARASGLVSCHLQTESGKERYWEANLTYQPIQHTTDVEGTSYVSKAIPVAEALPQGYHRLVLRTAGQEFTTQLITAPTRAYTPPDSAMQQVWGVFLPLYALHSEHSWGGGDFADLEACMDWVAALGGNVIGTLPLLSAFLDTPYDPSPYAPASRLFWNEFYIDLPRAPGLQESPEAQKLLTSSALRATLNTLRAASLVDYRSQMALKRQVLEALSRWFFAGSSDLPPEFHAFLRTHPEVEDYARFRAVGERYQGPWTSWPEPARRGLVSDGDYDTQVRNYHLYVQWVAHSQLKALADRGRATGMELYLDLPLGVHPQSYDTWREPAIFVRETAAGCPPDPVFTRGQNWGFPPLHPEAIREQGYRYCIAYLRHQLQHTGFLRIDHVMGLHRLFCIPQGLEVRQGVYVRYKAEELYAILNLESHRHQVCLVGENLGTVPTYVNTAMAHHHLHRMYVLQYAFTPASHGRLPSMARHTVASLNTHDMPPFAAYWQGLDISDRLAQGLLTRAEAKHEHQSRQKLMRALQGCLHQQGFLPTASAEAQEVLHACLAFLSAAPARLVLVTLEDLWLDTQPQNVPGTGVDHPNWQRKTRYSLEQLRHQAQVLTILRTVNTLRKQGGVCS